ncbi:alpha-ketoglutarate-dependent dioxygenase AlkB [Sphingomonas sp. 2R-10]|uniref:alpha-ketoglutarate-dependent dioxygenase AlkB n=1 Tax=Sphingomonas sp. 2R-10 TaxID=3045148 RepID=UPI000F78C00E|nr:alpha-ketoglutarate-dependent dioxygenase AlkB [Sphingomonas sp. 2R-10]MDJ0278451.1 alpha-ketoglutarate-dependent dioxygenase AlkB [Sphingomonas sp. 2R-10]
MPQLDLFAPEPGLPGLSHRAGVVGQDRLSAIAASIDGAPLTPFRFQQWTGLRLTASYGWHYDFERGQVGMAEPMPDWLRDVRRAAADFSGVPAQALVQALLTRYDPGAGIGWHRDRPVFEHVVGISIGAPAVLRFRRRTADGFARFALPLAAGDAYHLCGEARWDWEHGIAPMAATRWSITFRSLTQRFAREAGLA